MEELDLREKGGVRHGARQTSDERLFMQFLAFTGCVDIPQLCTALEAATFEGVLYEDLNDPQGVGLLTWSAQPAHFLDVVRPVLRRAPFRALIPLLVPRPLWVRANAVDSIAYDTSFVIGPALAAAVVTGVGAPFAILLRAARSPSAPRWPRAV